MQTEQEGASGATPNQTSEESGATTEEESNTNQQDDVVQLSKSDYERIKNDMISYKKKAQEYEGTIKQKEEEDLKKNNEWKTYAQKKEEEANEYSQKYQSLQQALVNEKKYGALKNAANKFGMRKEAMDDLEAFDFGDDVHVETTSQGRIIVHGAEDAMKKFKTLRPHWFGTRTAHVNNETPEETVGKKVTAKQIADAQKKAMKSGDWSEVKSLQKQYQSQ